MGNLPFKLCPVYRDYIWGGDRLKKEYNKKAPYDRVAESWECSVIPGSESTAASGRHVGEKLTDILSRHPEYLGRHKEIDILIKLIDARDRLSLQVHPDDSYAQSVENAKTGKEELWYILHSEPHSVIAAGLKSGVTKDDVKTGAEKGTLQDMVEYIPVQSGEGFLIPPGTVHGIGGGIVLCEIQQSCDITYRLYDYDRRDSSGNKRELHIDKALDVLKPGSRAIPTHNRDIGPVYYGRHFCVSRIPTGMTMYVGDGEYKIALVTEGECDMVTGGEALHLTRGESAFVPDGCDTIELKGDGCLLVIGAGNED